MDRRSLIFVIGLTVSLYFVNLWFSSKDEERRAAQPPVKREQVASQKQNESSPASPFTFATPEKVASEEQFYVLENDYQQLVFSNVGGALAEINLRLKDKNNPDSVVLPISFDKVMKESYPYNDRFPALSYHMVNPEKNSQISTLNPSTGGYYPLLRRSLFSAKGEMTKKTPPELYAFNLNGPDKDLSTTLYSVKRLGKDFIEFESATSNRRIVKVYSFPKDVDAAPYSFDVTIKVEGDTRGLSLTTGVPEVELISGSPSPSIQYRVPKAGSVQVQQMDLPKTFTTLSSVQPNWVCNSNGFLGIIVDPLTDIGTGFTAYQIPGAKDPTRLTLIDAHNNLYPADKYPGYELQLPLPAKNQTSTFRVFAGPFATDILEKVDTYYTNPETGYNPNYISCQSFHGWFAFISEPFAKFLFMLMKFFHKISFSWGISIILLTVALRIMLYPLNAWSIKSTLKMQQVAPQVSAIQAKYKKDPKRAQMEIMSLYREKGVNPLTGCFPLLIQMPFLIGMFDLLKSTFELRGASFIPGWIDNLTAPDVLFSWNYPIIFFGTDFHLLPFLLGAVMYYQQKMASPAQTKGPLTDQQRQQRFMGNIMTIVFTVMFYHFPSGLNIYWLSSMGLGILQQWWAARNLKVGKQEKGKGKGTTIEI